MEPFGEKSKRLLTVNYSCKKAPSLRNVRLGSKYASAFGKYILAYGVIEKAYRELYILVSVIRSKTLSRRVLVWMCLENPLVKNSNYGKPP